MNKNLIRIAENLNTLGDFLGKRDIKDLSNDELINKHNITQADMLILFGGSILYGCDIVGKAMKRNIAKNFMIVGGEGHTTKSLRSVVHNAFPHIITQGKMEADVMSEYINEKYGIENILIERNSSNCGNNVTNAIEIMKQNKISPSNIIIVQDSTMQQRMDAGFRKYLEGKKIKIINFAAYKVEVKVKEQKLVIEPPNILGMWDIKRYISLLMGEIPRLLDDADGYGPNGKNYIAHVDVPSHVLRSFNELKLEYSKLIRNANSLYATEK